MATPAWAKLHSQAMSKPVNPCYAWAVMAGTYLKQMLLPYILLSVTCSMPRHEIVRLVP